MLRWLLIGLAVVAGYALLPSVASMVGGMTDTLVSELTTLMPKLAIASGLVGLLALILPFTRHHAPGLIKAAFYVSAGAIVMTVGVPWVTAHTGTLTTAALGASDRVITNVTNTLGNAGTTGG